MKLLLLILILDFEMVLHVPNLNPLALGEIRTEILTEIWDQLDLIINFPIPGPGNDQGQPINVLQENCNTSLTQIYFRKDDYPGNYGQDRNDSSRVNVIFASEDNQWIIANQINQPQDFPENLENRYIGVLGVAICRRQKIEHVEIYEDVYFCDIETWLLFLCMRDDDVQENQLRHPADYNAYLGGRSESSNFINMARGRCGRRIGAVPRNARITPPLTNVLLQIVHAQRVFVKASQLANYDYILIRKRRQMRRPPPRQDTDAAQLDPNDCRDMSLLRNDALFLRRVFLRGGDIRQEYDFHWFFCNLVD